LGGKPQEQGDGLKPSAEEICREGGLVTGGKRFAAGAADWNGLGGRLGTGEGWDKNQPIVGGGFGARNLEVAGKKKRNIKRNVKPRKKSRLCGVIM